MTRTLLILALCLPAAAEDVTIKIAKGLAAGELVQLIHQTMGRPILYAPAGLEGKAIQASLEVKLPVAHAYDFLVFALSTCGLEVRPLEGPGGPLAVVVPGNALQCDFRLTGFAAPFEFSRGPGAWKGDADAADSLAAGTVASLLDALKAPAVASKRQAVLLLGLFGPRTAEAAKALGGVLADDALAADAAWALERFGWFGRPALEALRARAEQGEPFARALRTVETALHPALLKPSAAVARAPAVFDVDMTTTKGTFRIRVHRDWAPRGADRFYNLVRFGYFDDTAFHRVVKGFVAQFGLSGDPEVNRVWYAAKIDDDPRVESNRKGTVSFATSGEDSRTTQLFVNLKDNTRLDALGFAPLGEVVAGLDVVEKLHAGYGEGVDARQVHFRGAEYLRERFPELDWIRAARVVDAE